MSYFTQISYADSGSLDAFSRLRISSPDTLFSVQCQYAAAAIQMEPFASGTGVTPAHNGNTRMVALSCTAGTGVSAFQSFQYSPYAPGKSHFIAVTGVLGTGIADVTADVGYFDAANGVIFRQNGITDLQLILRTSTSGAVSDANIFAQSAWNIDKLDGTGSSGITLDVTKSFILIIDLQFLGMGRVRVGFDINGVLYYVHQFENANNLAVPYMQSATLPIQMLLTATGSVATKTSYFKCASVISEGGNILDYGYAISTPSATVTAGSGVRTHLLSVRPKTTYNGLPNREMFILNNLNMVVTGNREVYWEIAVGAAFTVDPTYANINTTYSGYESGTGGTFGNLTTGVVLYSGYLGNATASNVISREFDQKLSMHNPISLNRAGAVRPMGTISLLVTGLGGTSAVQGNFNFTEIR
jgi:hypothetical protein